MAAPTRPSRLKRPSRSNRSAANTANAKPKLDVAADSAQAKRPSELGTLLSAFTGMRRVPPPVNEPVKSYAPGSPERAELKARLLQMAGERADIPVVIGGREIRTGDLATTVMPHAHKHVLANFHRA